jgi:hypothetical protein
MTIDNETRTRLVREWMRSPVKQSEFCAAHGISTRALREWVRRFGIGDRPEARAVAIIDDAIERLRVLREALVAEEARQDGEAGQREPEPDEEDEERRAESERPAPTAAPQPPHDAERVKPVPMPAPGFPWF